MMSDPERVSRGNTPITVPAAEQEVQKNGKAPSEGRHRGSKTNKREDSLDLSRSALSELKGKAGRLV